MRNILWMVLHGGFRRNLDRWLEILAHKWKESKKIEEFSATKQRSYDNTYTKDVSSVEVTNPSVVNDHDTMIINETIPFFCCVFSAVI